jgi:hypothetical protein
MKAFAAVAPYLRHPLTLIGFGLFLVFGTFNRIIGAGILPTLNAEGGLQVVQLLLSYGFVLALVVTAMGLGLEYYKVHAATVVNAKVEVLLTEKLQAILPGLTKSIWEIASAAPPSGDKLEQAKADIREAENLIGQSGRRINAVNLVLMGKAYLLLGQPDRATSCFEQAMQEGPTDPAAAEARQGLAISYQLQANEAMRREDFHHER